MDDDDEPGGAAGIPSSIRLQLEEHPWEETIPRMLGIAAWQLRQMYWRGAWGENPPGLYDAHDIVQDLCKKVLTGKHKWDPEKVPSLFDFLRGRIWSEVSNLVQLKENKLERPASDAPADADEEEVRSNNLLGELLEVIEDDPEVVKFVEAVQDGFTPAEMAGKEGVPVKEINARRKRVVRRLKKAAEESRIAPGQRRGGEAGE